MTQIVASRIPLEEKSDWDKGDTFRILSSGEEVVASFLDTHHIYYTDEKESNSIRIDLVERIMRRRKAVILPAQEPTGRVDRERYQPREILSTQFRYFHSHSYYHYGPYVVLWESKNGGGYLVLPDEEKRRGVSPYLPAEWVVTRHDEDENEFDVLRRTTDKQEARAFFDALEEEYPQGIGPYNRAAAPHSHGGQRTGAGRPNELGKTKPVLVELPIAFFEEIDEQAKRESELADRKVSKSEVIRRRLGLER